MILKKFAHGDRKRYYVDTVGNRLKQDELEEPLKFNKIDLFVCCK